MKLLVLKKSVSNCGQRKLYKLLGMVQLYHMAYCVEVVMTKDPYIVGHIRFLFLFGMRNNLDFTERIVKNKTEKSPHFSQSG